MTQLMSGANVFRRVFVPEDDILNIQCKCLRFCDQKKNQVLSAKSELLEISIEGLYFYLKQLLIRLNCSD